MSHRNVVKTALSPQRKSKSPVRKFQFHEDIDDDSDSSSINNNEILSLIELLKELKPVLISTLPRLQEVKIIN